MYLVGCERYIKVENFIVPKLVPSNTALYLTFHALFHSVSTSWKLICPCIVRLPVRRRQDDNKKSTVEFCRVN